MLILYPETSLNLFIISNTLWIFIIFYMQDHQQTGTILLLPFQFGRLFWFLFLIALARTSSTILKRSVEIGLPSPVPDLRGKAGAWVVAGARCRYTYGDEGQGQQQGLGPTPGGLGAAGALVVSVHFCGCRSHHCCLHGTEGWWGELGQPGAGAQLEELAAVKPSRAGQWQESRPEPGPINSQKGSGCQHSLMWLWDLDRIPTVNITGKSLPSFFFFF